MVQSYSLFPGDRFRLGLRFENQPGFDSGFKISINTHEPIKDTGLRRTYPSWLSREGARGQEFNAWCVPPNPLEHTVMLPYTRMLAGPMDFTPGIFNLTYAWGWHNAVHDIALGKADAGALVGYYSRNDKSWPEDGIRMTFVSNHDKNSGDGTQFEQFGDAPENAIVLSVISEGMPLVHSGQEADNVKRLEFFGKDTIEWRDHRVGALYRVFTQ